MYNVPGRHESFCSESIKNISVTEFGPIYKTENIQRLNLSFLKGNIKVKK